VVSGAKETRRQIMLYTLVLAPLGLLPTLLGLAGWVYGAFAISLGAGFLFHSLRVLAEPQDRQGVSLIGDVAARNAFRFSLLHLAGLFSALALDHWLRALGVIG
jgi:protoheme IX farnesyltransferase